MIQIRHVPEDVHRKLTERAKGEGISLSDYLRRELLQLSQQQLDAALDERRRALAIMTAAYGGNHPKTADYMVELGPGSGEHGGELVFAGPLSRVNG